MYQFCFDCELRGAENSGVERGFSKANQSLTDYS